MWKTWSREKYLMDQLRYFKNTTWKQETNLNDFLTTYKTYCFLLTGTSFFCRYFLFNMFWLFLFIVVVYRSRVCFLQDLFLLNISIVLASQYLHFFEHWSPKYTLHYINGLLIKKFRSDILTRSIRVIKGTKVKILLIFPVKHVIDRTFYCTLTMCKTLSYLELFSDSQGK